MTDINVDGMAPGLKLEWFGSGYGDGSAGKLSFEQINDALAFAAPLIRNAGLEEAAQLLDAVADVAEPPMVALTTVTAGECARVVRSLKTPEPEARPKPPAKMPYGATGWDD